jgi:hypothetical protein
MFKKYLQNKRLFCSIIITILIAFISKSQNFETLYTADCIKKNEVRISLFSKSQLGINNNIELSSNIISDFLNPNINIKKIWYNREIIISTEHQLNYPKPALLLTRYSGLKNWINDTAYIPKTLMFNNKILVSRYFKTCRCCPRVFILTLKLGNTFNILKNDSSFNPINHPLLYHRTEVYNYMKFLWNIGIDFQGNLFEPLDFITSFDYYFILKEKIHCVENKSLIKWNYSKIWNFYGGFKIVYNFANISNHFFIFPLIDVKYHFNIPQKPKEDLFERKIGKKYR